MKNISVFILSLIVASAVNAQQIAGGASHTLVICSNGTVQAWGENSNGQLGDSTTVPSLTPVTVYNLSGVKAVAAGMFHSLALRTDSTVWSWGSNTSGQLGNATNTFSDVPVQVSSLNGIVAIACGIMQSYALKADGTVYAWGYNMNGELGNNTTTDTNLPVQVPGVNNVVAIAAGNNHFIVLLNDGTVWTCGNNNFGELGNATPVTYSASLVQVINLDSVVQITGGSNHSLALRADGTLWSWGYNYAGQLGDGTLLDSSFPVQVNLNDVSFISGGGNFSLALKEDSTVWSWGDNIYSQLGNGSAVQYSISPVQVTGLSGVREINSALAFSMALKSDGTVRTWGYNASGQLGNGNYVNSNIPVIAQGACVTSGIYAEENNSEYHLYPSFSNDLFFIQNFTDRMKTLNVFAMDGRLVLSQPLSREMNSISLAKQEDGIYIANIISGAGIIFSQKIIKHQ